jgi:hypothetical protein
MTPADILEASADYMEVHGWTRLEAISENGEVCMYGAFYEVTNSLPENSLSEYMDAYNQIREAYACLYKALEGYQIAEWNDHVCASKYEAIDMFRRAAKLAHKEYDPLGSETK